MKSSITTVMEFHPMGALLIHVDTCTDMPKAIGASHDCECT